MVIQRHNHMMNIEHAIPITPHSQGSENITDTQKTGWSLRGFLGKFFQAFFKMSDFGS